MATCTECECTTRERQPLNARFVNYFAANFRALIKRSGKTQKELARDLKVSASALVNYKQGRVPKDAELKRMCDYFQVSARDLVYGSFEHFLSDRADTTAFVQGATPDPHRQQMLADEINQWKDRALEAEKTLRAIRTKIDGLIPP
jgi:transcriptional regulator with XRE-family HTH domain